MRHRKAVAAAYLLAVVAIGMLAYLAAPHRTALAAGQLAVPQQPRATQLAPTHSQRSAHGRRTPRQVKKHGTTVPTEKMRLLAHGKAARHAALADSVQKRQILLYDSVTVGPYGTYDAQTYYFHPNGVEAEGDGTMYQPEIIHDDLAPSEGSLVPWTWGEAVYQPGPDMGNLAAPPPKNPLVPWTWDDIIYQTPGAE